jgi:hypothetical protein
LRVQLQYLTASLVSQGKAWKESQFDVLRQGPHREHCLVNGEFNQDLSDFRISGECELFSLPQFAPIVPLLIAFCVDFKPEQFYLPRSLLEGRAGTLSDEYLYAFMAEQASNNAPPKIARKAVLPQRNQPCPCGSGRKYKHCCANKAPDEGA